MSDVGGDAPPIKQAFLVEMDSASSRQFMDELARTMTKAMGKANQALVKGMRRANNDMLNEMRTFNRQALRQQEQYNNRSQRLFESNLRQHERLQVRYIQKEQDRDRGRLQRLAQRQAAAQARSLQDAKRADNLALQAQRHTDRTTELIAEDTRKRIRQGERRDDWIRTHEIEQEARKRIQTHYQEQVRTTQAQQAGHRRQQAELEAHQARITNRHKAMWSMVRSITETGARATASLGQSAIRGMARGIGSAWTSIVSHTRSGTSRQEALVASSMRDQTRTVTLAMARQEGAIASFQTTLQRGAVGSLINLRNLVLGFGGVMSARAIFGPLQEYEQTRTSFENLLGSVEAADAMLAQLRQFNVETPFELPQITNAAKQLLAMGETAQEVVPDLQAIGDVGAKFSASSEDVAGVIRALGQMSQSARVSAQDINQIQQRFVGFNARAAIARGLGVSVAEAMEMIADGSITGNEGMNAMVEGMKSEENAAGAMEEQMKTLTGAISNFTDMVQMALIDALYPYIDNMSAAVRATTQFIDSILHGSGVFAVVRSGLIGIAIALAAIAAQKAAVGVMQLMGTALKLIAANPISALAIALTTIGTILYRHNDTFKAFVDDFLDKIGEFVDRYATPVRNFLEEFATGISGIASSLMEGDWDGAYQQLAVGVTRIREALQPAVDFLVKFGQDAWQKWQEWLDSGGLGDLADTLADRVRGALSSLGDRLAGINWGAVLGVALGGAGLAITGLVVGWPVAIGAALVAGFIALSPRVRDGIGELFSQAGDWISETFGEIDWASVGMAVLGGLRSIGEFIGGPVVEAIFSETGLKVMGAILAGVGAFALGLVQGLARSIPKAWRNLRHLVIHDLGRMIGDALKDTPVGPLVDGLLETLNRAFEVLSGVADFGAAIVNALTGRGDWGDVGDALGDLLLDLFHLVLSAPQLVRGISDSFNQLVTAALDGLSSLITDWASNLDGPLGGIVEAFSAQFALIFGVVSDVLDRIRDFVRGWIDVIAGIFSGDWGRVFEGMREVWGSLLGLARDIFGRLQTYLWHLFRGIGRFLWGAARSGFRWLMDRIGQWIDNLVSFWTGLPGRMADAFIGFGGLVIDAIKSGIGHGASFAKDIVNSIIRFINQHVLQPISDFHINLPFGREFNFPDLGPIPTLADGGIVTQPTLALIGEAGPEAVVPLSGNAAGVLPFTISFDLAAVASQVETIVAVLTPLGDRLVEATAPGMRGWAQAIRDVLRDIRTGFDNWGDRMIDLSERIADGITDGITSGLRSGKREVLGIARGYARSLVGALNPLLTGVGESPIHLAFAKGGIAEAHQGAQVHVFNEGRRGRGSSHGEAYIPFDPSNRPRSRDLASETVRRLGGNVQWFAQGGITANQIQPGQSVPGVSGDVVGLVNEFARRLSAWSLANGGSYHVGSGYRSIAEQTRLYQRYLAGVPGQARAAPPGQSLHNFGLASDGSHWRDRNPAAYGLVFPMSYEPWHVQPVEGRALAGGDSDFPAFDPLPRPPSAGRRGWLSRAASAVMQYVYDKVLSASGNLTMPGSAVSLGSNARSDIIAELARQAGLRGWSTGSQWSSLLSIIDHESSFNPNAQNPTSTAYGLFQFLNGTWAGTGVAKTSNFVQQIVAGLRYIASKYGDPSGAWAFWQRNHWYANGGIIDRDGLYRVGEGNRPEAVIPLTRPARALDLLRQTGLDDLLRASDAANGNRSSSPTSINLAISVDGNVDPALHAELAGAVRSGVMESMSRADRIKESWN